MSPDPNQVPKGRHKRRARLWIAAAAVAAILALLIVPPLLSISRYKNRITQLMTASLGRPVRLSSVELRLLPRPAFVLTDLILQEDPAYGAEPVLHASTVTASIRILPLWRGRLQISRISVDEASMNLVQSPSGGWNLDSLFRTAASKPGQAGGRTMPLPYIEATNSRINIKNGAEKLPFSLLGADLSLWQEAGGTWRVRLRGQPSRTDVSLDLPDTGVVRLEATLGPAPELLQMPLNLDVDWREAQLGQLSRLILGSDQGWRGDMTGEIHVVGTADTAQVKTRLRASGVHRAEFTPAAPIDFDATCSFVAHFSVRGAQNLVCESPVGDGRARLTGDVPRGGQPPRLSLELDRIPAQAGLDALRTLRINLDPGLEATGAVSGKMTYDGAATNDVSAARPATSPNRSGPIRSKSQPAPAQNALSGSFTAENLRVSGDGLSKPILIARMTFEPVAGQPGQPPALATTMALPAGGAAPLTVTARLNLRGYQMAVHGTAAMPRLRELARIAGVPEASELDQVAGEPAVLDLAAEGPWLPATVTSLASGGAPRTSVIEGIAPASADSASDKLSGTVVLHNANWKSDFLANPVEISTATLHLDNGSVRWDPVAFSYGPVKGTATLEPSGPCEAPQTCSAHFTLQFGSLDAAALQAAILGAHEPGTLLSTLIARLRPSSAPSWPPLEGAVRADALILAPVTLTNVSASVRILPAGAEISSLDAGLLGGRVHGSSVISAKDKPDYKLEGKFEKLNAAQVGQLLGMSWSGGGLDGAAEVELSGYTDKDLSASARGTMHFEWHDGSVAGATAAVPTLLLARFDQWTADAAIADGAITLKQNRIQRGARKSAVEASAAFGNPARVTFADPQEAHSAKR